MLVVLETDLELLAVYRGEDCQDKHVLGDIT